MFMIATCVAGNLENSVLLCSSLCVKFLPQCTLYTKHPYIAFACFCISPSVHSETCFFECAQLYNLTVVFDGFLQNVVASAGVPQAATGAAGLWPNQWKRPQAVCVWGRRPGCERVWHLVFSPNCLARVPRRTTLSPCSIFPHRVHHNSRNKWAISAPDPNGTYFFWLPSWLDVVTMEASKSRTSKS